MTDNIFVNRFSKMTNDELEAISFNEDVYTDEARLTALDILKSRDVNTEAISIAHDTLVADKITNEKIVLNIPSATESFSLNDKTKEQPLPELHSKRLIMMFSLFFSTIFGGALLMYNLKKTGHSKARTQVLIFCIFYAFIPFMLITSFHLDNNISIFANIIGGFILTEYFWNKFIGKTFEYKKRDWVKPTLISLAITIPLAILVLYFGGGLPA